MGLGGSQSPEFSSTLLCMDALRLTLSVLDESFIVCRLDGDTEVPARLLELDFFSITRTGDELSVIVPEGALGEEVLPAGAKVEADWACLEVEGPLALSLVGVLAALSGTLAEAGVSLFAVSTYDTDYLLVKNGELEKAVSTLSEAGHTVS